MVQQISAITLAVREMARAVDFYRDKVGMELLYGGETASFSSFQIGGGYLNLILVPEGGWSWWGRLIFHVNDVDAIYRRLVEAGLTPSTEPRDAMWGGTLLPHQRPRLPRTEFRQAAGTPAYCLMNGLIPCPSSRRRPGPSKSFSGFRPSPERRRWWVSRMISLVLSYLRDCTLGGAIAELVAL